MNWFEGISLCPGGAVGPIHVLPALTNQKGVSLPTVEEELERLEAARETALARLEEQRAAAREQLGEEEAEIFRLHTLMLEDQDFVETAQKAVRAGRCAEDGVREAEETFAAAFRALDDPYLQGRMADVEEVSRLWREVLAGGAGRLELERPAILWAKECSPGELIALDRDKALGLVVEHMAPDSHAAILVRAMGLPTVTGIAPQKHWEGVYAALDAERGRLWLEPEESVRTALEQKCRQEQARRRELERWRDAPVRTRDGRTVTVCANIGSAKEAALALEQGAQGVGLFRTEFLCLDKERSPGEEEQFAVYRQALEAMQGRRVVIRTLDIGGDKRPPWLETGQGENPALGLRGIRLSLKRPELFVPQLRAVLRAARYGKAAVMFPMVTSPAEVRNARAMLDRCRAELEEEGRSTGEVEVGVMIETPAAALMAGELAEEADFFSIGTNDLVQYVLAADRGNPAVARLYSPFQPAVLRLLDRIIRSAKAEGIPCCLCGGAAEDPEFLPLLVGMGLEEISVSIHNILNARRTVCLLDDEAAEKRAREALCGRTLSDTKPSNKEVDHHV